LDFRIESRPTPGSLNGVNSMMTFPRVIGAGCAFLTLTILATSAADWPRWRGPLNTGEAVGEPALNSLPATPTVLWKIDAGEGFTSPVIAGGKVAFMDNEDGREVLRLLNAADGRELWKAEIDDVFRDSQGPPGPRNTAVFDGDHLYAVSCKGELQCRAVADGKLLWRTSYTNDLHAVFIGERGTAPGATRHGNNGSPLIDVPHLIAPVGGTNGHSVVAFDKLTGKIAWHSQDDVAGYSGPVLAEIAGVKQIIAFTADGIIGLRRDNGQLLWRVPMQTAYARHVMTPVVWNDIVVAGSHTAGLVGIKVTAEDGTVKAEQVWVNKDAAPNFIHPVARGQHFFTLGPRKNIQCVDLATGEVKWSEDGLVITSADKAYAGFLRIGENVLMLTDAGELVLFKATAEKCEVLSRVQVAGVNWCNPAYADGVLYLRDGIRGKGNLLAVKLTP
jgi:outer membrane protein assembly factor BamB